MEDRQNRLMILRKILSDGSSNTHSNILNKLKIEGYEISQGTLSRDLRQLNAIKMPDSIYGYVYLLNEDIKELEMAANTAAEENSGVMAAFLTMEFSGNLAVIRTLPAFAGSIAILIDKTNIFGIMGTIAGDDTILVILREGVSSKKVRTAFAMEFPEIKDKI